MTPTQYTAAIDLGGTQVRAAIVAEDGTIVARARRRTPVEAPRPDLLPELVDEVRAEAGGLAVNCAVVGIPGIVDHETEALVAAPNLPAAWVEPLTGSQLSAAMGIPVSLANDADLAAVGEAAFGAGRLHRDVVYVTISTGVGAGIVVDRSLVRGTLSGGELGHTIIDAEAARAGRPATVEALGAGPAIAKAAAEAGIDERDAALADLVRRGEPAAVALWNRAMSAVGIGVANLAWMISPQVVVIGGGVGNNGDIVLPIIKAIIDDLGPAVASTAEGIDVVGAALGDDAALAGSAAWFRAIGRSVGPTPLGLA